MPDADSLPRLWKNLRPVATMLMLVAIGFAVVRYTASNWALMTDYPWQLDWIWVLAALATMSAFFLGLAAGWRNALAWHGVAVPWLGGLWVWSRSSLTGYLPTPIWIIASRIYLTTQLGVTWRAAAISMATALAGSVSGAFAIAMLAVSLWLDISLAVYVPLVAGVVVIGLPLAYAAVLRVGQRFNDVPRGNFYRLSAWSVQYSITFVIFGIANILVLKSLGISVPPVHLVIGISALAWALGTLNILSPSGLGTRELILAVGLESYLGPPELLAFGVGSRLAALGGELLLFGAIYATTVGRRAATPRPGKQSPPLELASKK